MTESSPQTAHSDTTASGSNWRVLVVDDEEIIRTLVEKILKRVGIGTITVSSGQAAIEAMTVWGNETAIAIVDFSMDGMSGIDTIRNLTKIMPNLRFIVSSGHAIGQNEIPIELHDRVSFLQKPYRANELSELVMSLIKRR